MRRWLLAAMLGLSGCMELEEFAFHDHFAHDAAFAPPCGCSSTGAQTTARPTAAPGPIQTVAGTAPVPQSREPELLR